MREEEGLKQFVFLRERARGGWKATKDMKVRDRSECREDHKIGCVRDKVQAAGWKVQRRMMYFCIDDTEKGRKTW